MSQFFIQGSGGTPPPPGTVGFLSGQIGTNPVPPDGANNINIFAEETTANVLVGIQTRGDAAGNTIWVQLTNRIQGFISTNDATPTTIITFPMGATPGVYKFDGNIEAFNTTDVAGAAYGFQIAIRTTGAAGTVIGVSFDDDFEEAAMAAANFTVTASGNNYLVQVIGIAGKAIDWRCLTTYRFTG